jgi:hypothetical protein
LDDVSLLLFVLLEEEVLVLALLEVDNRNGNILINIVVLLFLGSFWPNDE